MQDQNKSLEYKKDWMRRRRAEYFAGKTCVDCGSTENLELDHIDRSKKVHHNIWSWKLEKREAELAKCAPRCKACHRKKTNLEISQRAEPLTHGTYRGYRNGCRCSQCGEARLLYRKGLLGSNEVIESRGATHTATEDLLVWGEFPVGFKPSRKLLKELELVPGARFELARGS